MKRTLLNVSLAAGLLSALTAKFLLWGAYLKVCQPYPQVITWMAIFSGVGLILLILNAKNKQAG
jgi:hypothetical protein